MKSYVYFIDKTRPCWDCEVLRETSTGVTVRMYSKETFFPWHMIERIVKHG